MCNNKRSIIIGCALISIQLPKMVVVENSPRSGKTMNDQEYNEYQERKNRDNKQEFEPPEYNRTKHINLKPNAKPVKGLNFKRMARNNIKKQNYVR